jgi:hypothetical protein
VQPRVINSQLLPVGVITPALNRANAMFSLTLKLELSYKQLVQLVVLLFMLFTG